MLDGDLKTTTRRSLATARHAGPPMLKQQQGHPRRVRGRAGGGQPGRGAARQHSSVTFLPPRSRRRPTSSSITEDQAKEQTGLRGRQARSRAANGIGARRHGNRRRAHDLRGRRVLAERAGAPHSGPPWRCIQRRWQQRAVRFILGRSSWATFFPAVVGGRRSGVALARLIFGRTPQGLGNGPGKHRRR